MAEEKDHYEGALLEEVRHQQGVTLEYVLGMREDMKVIKKDISTIKKSVQDIKAEQRYMRTMHSDKNRRLDNHEVRITRLEN
jgi:hypothetical protein